MAVKSALHNDVLQLLCSVHEIWQQSTLRAFLGRVKRTTRYFVATPVTFPEVKLPSAKNTCVRNNMAQR